MLVLQKCNTYFRSEPLLEHPAEVRVTCPMGLRKGLLAQKVQVDWQSQEQLKTVMEPLNWIWPFYCFSLLLMCIFVLLYRFVYQINFQHFLFSLYYVVLLNSFNIFHHFDRFQSKSKIIFFVFAMIGFKLMNNIWNGSMSSNLISINLNYLLVNYRDVLNSSYQPCWFKGTREKKTNFDFSIKKQSLVQFTF